MQRYNLRSMSLTLLLAACGGTEQVRQAARNVDSTAKPVAPSVAPSAPTDWRVTLRAAGPIVFGATLAEATQASDGKFVARAAESCASVRVPGSPAGMRFMVEAGHVVRVDVDSAGAVTDRGAGVGMSETDVQRAYGDSLRVMLHKYDPAGHYLVYNPSQPADSSLRIVFETNGKAVTRYRAGVEPAVEYVEGCG